MATRADLGALYRGCRERITELVSAEDDPASVPVPTCPGWSVHDVVSHLVGALEDSMPAEGPVPEWTEPQVERRRGADTTEVLARWAELAPAVEGFLSENPFGPAVFDVASHEHDIRTALGIPGDRDDEAVRWAAGKLLRSLEVPSPLLVRTEDGQVRLGPEGGEPTVLTTTRFEVFRWRLGRRSRAQLAAMAWSGDPEPFLDHLCVFGPADHDIVE